MLYTVFPETTGREFLANDDGAALQEAVADTEYASVSVIQWQRAVNNVRWS